MGRFSGSNRIIPAVAATIALVSPATSGEFLVTLTTDGDDGVCDSHCTLREAVRAANVSFGKDTIVLPEGIYNISIGGPGEDEAATGDLDVTDELVLIGSGARHTVIDGAALDRVLEVRPSGALDLSRVTVRNGHVSGTGGGILAYGPLTMTACAVIENSTAGFGFGGGIASESVTGFLQVIRSTVAGNSADGGGGGILVSGVAILKEVTISGNQSVSDFGGGVYLFSDSSMELVGGTVVGNSSNLGGGLLAEADSTFSVSNTIIALNSAPSRPDCSGTYTSLGHNLVGDRSTCFGFGALGDLIGDAASPINPRLVSLGPQGGETDTHRPLPGSPVIDAGSSAAPDSEGGSCSPTDQRLAPRPIDGGGAAGAICDIGAHEAGAIFVESFETADTNRWSETSQDPPG